MSDKEISNQNNDAYACYEQAGGQTRGGIAELYRVFTLGAFNRHKTIGDRLDVDILAIDSCAPAAAEIDGMTEQGYLDRLFVGNRKEDYLRRFERDICLEALGIVFKLVDGALAPVLDRIDIVVVIGLDISLALILDLCHKLTIIVSLCIGNNEIATQQCVSV